MYTNDIARDFSLQLYYQHATDFPINDVLYVRIMQDGQMLTYPFMRDALIGSFLALVA